MADLHLAQEIFNLIYPVGSVYISVNNVNPSTLFGGTWEEIRGLFLLGHDPNTSMAHKTLGANIGDWYTKYHALTIDEMPSHNHEIDIGSFANGGEDWNSIKNGHIAPQNNQGTRFTTRTKGSGNGHNHQFCPPALVVKIWKRTA